MKDLPRSPVAPPLDSCFLRPARPANRRPPSRWAARSPSSSPNYKDNTEQFLFPSPIRSAKPITETEESSQELPQPPAWGHPAPAKPAHCPLFSSSTLLIFLPILTAPTVHLPLHFGLFSLSVLWSHLLSLFFFLLNSYSIFSSPLIFMCPSGFAIPLSSFSSVLSYRLSSHLLISLHIIILIHPINTLTFICVLWLLSSHLLLYLIFILCSSLSALTPSNHCPCRPPSLLSSPPSRLL